MGATGKGANERINMNDLAEAAKVMSAIARQEHGRRYSEFTPEVIVKILNSTGSDVTTQTTQAAAH
jgi:hypothetical protein